MQLKKIHIEMLLITLRVEEAIELLLKCNDSNLRMIVRQKESELNSKAKIETVIEYSKLSIISNELLYIVRNYPNLEIPYNLLAPNFNSELLELISIREKVEFALSKFTDLEILKEAKELQIRLINLESMILFDKSIFNSTLLLDRQSALEVRGKEFTKEFSTSLELIKNSFYAFCENTKKK